ncbi:MAG: hypothetical protein A2049_09220 [Elusimicrobia bacterium GWA2_62_23]|nr:MAG: hypothetical protein A2049_09220 [Elusimicrobia bacterium GWA2_62_23]
MNKKLVLWMGVLALTAVPAVSVLAQEGPEDDGPGAEMMDEGGGPGMMPGGPGAGFGAGQGKFGGGPGMNPGMQQMMIKKKMMARGGKGAGGPGFLSEEETLAVIKKHDPAFAAKVAGLRETAPAKYRMILQMSGKLFAVGKMEKDESIEKDAVRALALEFETKELSVKYGNATDSEKKAIKESLKAKLGELFDLKTRGQELRVRHMEREIGKLKKNIETRKANKAKIVDQRLEQMTGEGFGW